MAFALGWKAANLIARDRLEDVLLEAAISGVESVSTRTDGVTRRRALNTGLSMGVLNRLDRVQASLDDSAAAVSRTIAAAFDEFLSVIAAGGGDIRIANFLKRHTDPLAVQVARTAQAEASATAPTPAPQLVEKSAIVRPVLVPDVAVRVPVIVSAPASEPCSCPADRKLALLEAV